MSYKLLTHIDTFLDPITHDPIMGINDICALIPLAFNCEISWKGYPALIHAMHVPVVI